MDSGGSTDEHARVTERMATPLGRRGSRGKSRARASDQAPVPGQLLFFFFSSRRRHTRCSRDWSSDVCSSDLFTKGNRPELAAKETKELGIIESYLPRGATEAEMDAAISKAIAETAANSMRSEERRVGKEGRSRWSPDH